MLQDAVLMPGLEIRIDFSGPNGFVRLLDAEAQHLLLNMRFSAPDGILYLNTQTDGIWGKPEQIPLPEKEGPARHRVFFRLTDVLEIWNAEHRHRFERFDAGVAGQVRFSVFRNALNPGETLKLSVPRPEEMAAQIAAQVAMRRLDMLERKLQDGAGGEPAGI